LIHHGKHWISAEKHRKETEDRLFREEDRQRWWKKFAPLETGLEFSESQPRPPPEGRGFNSNQRELVRAGTRKRIRGRGFLKEGLGIFGLPFRGYTERSETEGHRVSFDALGSSGKFTKSSQTPQLNAEKWAANRFRAEE